MHKLSTKMNYDCMGTHYRKLLFVPIGCEIPLTSHFSHPDNIHTNSYCYIFTTHLCSQQTGWIIGS